MKQRDKQTDRQSQLLTIMTPSYSAEISIEMQQATDKTIDYIYAIRVTELKNYRNHQYNSQQTHNMKIMHYQKLLKLLGNAA